MARGLPSSPVLPEIQEAKQKEVPALLKPAPAKSGLIRVTVTVELDSGPFVVEMDVAMRGGVLASQLIPQAVGPKVRELFGTLGRVYDVS